jgi:predicted nucleic acid-binding Zn ribbon protein
MNYCKHGCGQEGKFQLKNGEWICSDNVSKCPEIRKKNSISVKEGRRLEKEKGIKRAFALKRVSCQYCSKNITVQNIKHHEFSCYLNPKNIRLCPICETPIKDKNSTTCSQKCGQVYFKDMFNEIRKTRDMSWANGHSYTFICFKYHEKNVLYVVKIL